MKKTILLGGIFLSLSSAIFVLTGNFASINSGYLIPDAGKGKAIVNANPPALNFSTSNLFQTIDDVDFDGKKITIVSKTQRLGVLSNASIAQIGAGNSYFPVVMIDKFDVESNLSTHESLPVNLVDIINKPIAYKIMDADNSGIVIGTNEDDIRIQTIESNYPQAFLTNVGSASKSRDTMKVSYFFGSYSLAAYTWTKKLDAQKELQTYEVKNILNPERVDFGGAEYKLFPWGISFYNEKRNTVTVPVGCNRKDLKNQFYKEFAYVTHGFDGKIVNQTIVKFDYTKDHEFIKLVDNAATGEKQLVAILGNKMYMGKQNDPAVNKFTLLVLNPDGTQKLLKDFQYGLKAREFMPAFAFMNGDLTYVVSKNKLNSSIETFVFDAKGELTIQKQSSVDLFAKTYGNKNGAMSFVAGSQAYVPFGLKILSSGNMVLLTDDVYSESVPNPNAKPGDMNQTLSESRYRNVIAFEFTPAGECTGQYVLFKNFSHIKTPTCVEEIIMKDNKIFLLTLDKNEAIENPIINAIHNNQIVTKGCREACRPALFSINLTDKKVDVIKPLDPLYINLYGTQSYYLLNDKSGVVYYGFITGRTTNAFEFQVNSMKF